MKHRAIVALLTLCACGSAQDQDPLTTADAGDDPPLDFIDAGPDDPGTHARIAEENKREGTSDWQIGKPAMSGQVEGYASSISVASGANVAIAVAASPASVVSWRVFRMGYYGGAGGREVTSGTVQGKPQSAPSFDGTTGLVRVSWPAAFELDTAGWLTGVYLVLLENAGGFQSYVPFVVRDDRRDAEVAVQLPTATWQAYNRWGGESLYFTSHGMSGGKARKVSYDRPIHPELGYGSGLFLAQEQPGVAAIEAGGYDVEYLTSGDVGGERGRVGGGHKLYVAIGHDEYNTIEAIERLGAAADRGVNLAFFTGNTFYWQIRWEDGGRTQVCYKDTVSEDPLVGVDDKHVATAFRDPPVNRPENALIGVMSKGRAVSENVPWVVTKADHWLYTGTGLANGDTIPGLVGFEWDTDYHNDTRPKGLVVLADSPVRSFSEHHNASIYARGSAFVLATGTLDFTRRMGDPLVHRMVDNVFARAGAGRY